MLFDVELPEELQCLPEGTELSLPQIQEFLSRLQHYLDTSRTTIAATTQQHQTEFVAAAARLMDLQQEMDSIGGKLDLIEQLLSAPVI